MPLPFLSTLSLRRATCSTRSSSAGALFLSTLSLRRATAKLVRAAQQLGISIHALLAESDLLPFAMTITALDFYPRSPCGERPSSVLILSSPYIFLSTLSLRRATFTFPKRSADSAISIHALLAESDPVRLPRQRPDFYFYPRSPCGERLSAQNQPPPVWTFLSTLSLRRATYCFFSFFAHSSISIHALLAESDCANVRAPRLGIAFLSTLSLRRATADPRTIKTGLKFLSTLSLRRATYASRDFIRNRLFLSTLSLRRATVAVYVHRLPPWDFYPRSPCGERHPGRSGL